MAAFIEEACHFTFMHGYQQKVLSGFKNTEVMGDGPDFVIVGDREIRSHMS